MRDTGKTWDGLPVYTLDYDTDEFQVRNVGTKEEPVPALVVGRNLSNSHKRDLDKTTIDFLVHQVMTGKSEPLNEAAEEEVRREQENQ